jgi:hypothetical protein
MNIEELKNHINIWKPIDKFPLYKDLVIEAKKYYNNNLKYCFSNYNKDIYIINFEYVNDNGSFNLTYGYFSDILKDIWTPHLEFKEYIPNIRKYNFNKNIKDVFKLYKLYEQELICYTHIYNIYKIISNSINF